MTIVVKRPDQPELDNPYYSALEGDEYQVMDKKYKDEKYPPVFATCHKESVALQIATAFNNGVITEDGQ